MSCTVLLQTQRWVEEDGTLLRAPEIAATLRTGSRVRGQEFIDVSDEIMYHNKHVRMLAELVVSGAVVPIHRYLLQGTTPQFHLTIRPGIIEASKAMLDLIALANPVEDMAKAAGNW